MPKYILRVIEEVLSFYEIEAESPEDAEDKFYADEGSLWQIRESEFLGTVEIVDITEASQVDHLSPFIRR